MSRHGRNSLALNHLELPPVRDSHGSAGAAPTTIESLNLFIVGVAASGQTKSASQKHRKGKVTWMRREDENRERGYVRPSGRDFRATISPPSFGKVPPLRTGVASAVSDREVRLAIWHDSPFTDVFEESQTDRAGFPQVCHPSLSVTP